MDTHGLAKAGFLIIRNILEGRCSGGIEAAFELAEALHNLPEPGNKVTTKLTVDLLSAFVGKYPQHHEHLALYVQIKDSVSQADMVE